MANVSEGADLAIGNGSLELNALLNPEAYFHVDGDALSSLTLEEQNGTNFVNCWADVLSNGVYATASTQTFDNWLSDPENRRPFISEEKLNGRAVVDFGPLQVASHTNDAGYGVGYGASMKWSKRLPSATRELFIVSRDTDEINTLKGTGNIAHPEFGQAFFGDPDSKCGFRGELRDNAWPLIVQDHAYNDEIRYGQLHMDGVSKYWKISTGNEYHVLQFSLPGTNDAIRPSYFARSYPKAGGSYHHTLGGTKIAEYLVFDHPLEATVSTNINSALRTKWFNDARAVQKFGNLTVGTGASVSIPWNDVVVTNCFTLGGNLTVNCVKAAALRLTTSNVSVSGNLTLEDGAVVTVETLPDGSFSSLSSAELELLGGGKIVFAAASGVKPSIGETKILDKFTGSLDNWTVDASAITKVSVSLIVKDDGLYAVVSPKGTVVLVR